MNLKDQIRRAREAKGLTQAELADKLGVDRKTVGNWETGSSSPRNKMTQLERVLEISLREESARAALPRDEILLKLPDSTLKGLSPAEVDEVASAARHAALQAARGIRRELEEREQQRQFQEMAARRFQEQRVPEPLAPGEESQVPPDEGV